MNRFIKNESGSALAMTLIVMVVLTILGTVLLNISLAENKFANRNEDKLQAYYIARSGAQAVAEYMVQDNHNKAKNIVGNTSGDNTQIGGGKFSVAVFQDAVNSSVVNIVSTGTYNKISQTAKIVVLKTSTGVGGLFNHAIVAENSIDVASNGQSTVIDGSIASINGTITIDKANAGGTEENAEILLPVIDMPENSEYNQMFGDLKIVKKDGNLILPAAGHTPTVSELGIDEYFYHADSIELKDVAIRIKDTTDVTPVGSIPNFVVHFYVEGDITLDTKAQLTAGDSTLLYVYVKGEHTVTLSGSGEQNNVYIYAPESDIIWNNAQPNNEFYGGLVGKNVTLTNQLLIKHNPALANYSNLDTTNVGINFTGYRWID